MYVWLGIDVNEQLLELRRRGSILEDKIGCVNSVYTLPMHISLKISFEVTPYVFPEILSLVEDIYTSVSPFGVEPRGIECEEGIVWLRMNRSEALESLSTRLNGALLDKFGIPLHEYDTDFKFHSTLYIDSDSDRVEQFFREISAAPVPDVLMVKRLVVGTSPEGELGTYSVYRAYDLI